MHEGKLGIGIGGGLKFRQRLIVLLEIQMILADKQPVFGRTVADLDQLPGGAVVEFLTVRAVSRIRQYVQVRQLPGFLRPERFQRGRGIGPAVAQKNSRVPADSGAAAHPAGRAPPIRTARIALSEIHSAGSTRDRYSAGFPRPAASGARPDAAFPEPSSTACAACRPRPDWRRLLPIAGPRPEPGGSRAPLHRVDRGSERPARAEKSAPDSLRARVRTPRAAPWPPPQANLGAGIAAAALAASSKTKHRIVIRALDTGFTLCCSVRQCTL